LLKTIRRIQRRTRTIELGRSEKRRGKRTKIRIRLRQRKKKGEIREQQRIP
jgi:hypothetical protein